jgi:hypothetical protein
MKNTTIITLVISGLIIALIGVGLDYQRRVRSRAEYDQWRASQRAVEEQQRRLSDAKMAAVDQSLMELSRASAESLEKIEDAKRLALAISQDEAREQKRLELLRMRLGAEDSLNKASAESDRALLGAENREPRTEN